MPNSISTFLRRDNFPRGFTFGAASSAFQIEGAANEDGRGPSIWDTYCENKVLGNKVGKAIDHYHQYKEDVAMMKWMGLDAYRFSISWSRILPTGRKSGGLNFDGVKFYKNLIDELLKNGIKPHVSLLYWDVPQTLEKEYGGFRDPKIVDDFGDYADICFMIFGKEVKNWTTINKPWSFSEGGYVSGNLAPCRGEEEPNSPKAGNSEGDPAKEPYVVTHHQLLAHAKAVEVYRTMYQKIQKGQIGIALNSFWFEPASNSEEDKKARDRALDFTLNWFLDPITVGQYPNGVEKIMNERNIGHKFSQKGSGEVKGSIDFLGIDYCTASCVRDKPGLDKENDANYTTDYNVEYPEKPPLGEIWPGAVDNVYPQGLKDLLNYVKSKYKGPIYITENGYGEKNDDSLLRHEALHDNRRLSYLHKHLSQIVEVTKDPTDKVDVKGYFAYSLWDNFEWDSRFNNRYGLIHVDFKNDLKRTPKFSAHWLKYTLQKSARKKKRHGLTKTGSEPRSIPTSSPSTRSLQPSAANLAVGMHSSNFASNDSKTMSASSLGSNNFGTMHATKLSRRDLENASEYEEDEDYESETNSDTDGLNELESGSMIEDDQESDNDSDPAHGSMDDEDEEDSDVNSAPIRPVATRRTR